MLVLPPIPRFLCIRSRHLTSLLLTALFLAVLVPDARARQSLSREEQRVVQEIDARSDDAIDLLERAVNINSGTMNFEGVKAVADLYTQELRPLGVDVTWIDGGAFNRAGHLLARLEGDPDAPHLLLIGHLDTVFEPSSPFQRFDRAGDRADGPGVVDMKGGDTVIIHALKAFHAAGLLDHLNLTIVMTGDEERSGAPLEEARRVLIDAAKEADIALAFENGDSNPRTAVVARRGSTGWRLDVTGTPAHSSQLFQPEVGSGAVYEVSRILTGFYEALAGEPDLTFNPGVMVAGTDVTYEPMEAAGTAFGKSNVVAGHAIVTGDLRTISIEQLTATHQKMAFIARQNLPGTTAELTFGDGYPPLSPTPGNYELLTLFSGISEDLGYGPVAPVDPRNAGAADVSFTAGLVEKAIDGLGPGGGNDHTVDEWIDLPTLEMQTKRSALLIWRLSN